MPCRAVHIWWSLGAVAAPTISTFFRHSRLWAKFRWFFFFCNRGNVSNPLLSSAVQVSPVSCKMDVPLASSAEQDQIKSYTDHIYCRQGPWLRCSWWNQGQSQAPYVLRVSPFLFSRGPQTEADGVPSKVEIRRWWQRTAVSPLCSGIDWEDDVSA